MATMVSMLKKRGETNWLYPWLVTIIVAIFLFPSIRTPGAIPSMRLEELILIPFALYCMLRIIRGHDVRFAWGVRQKTLLFFFVFLLISMLAGMCLGHNASFGDLNQFIRFCKYILIYTIAVSYIYICYNKDEAIDRVYNVIVICSVLLAVVVVQQFFDLFGLNSLYVRYVAPTQFETLIGDHPFPRPVGMVGNPNEVGFVFVLGALTSSYRLIKGGGWVFLAATLINLASLGLTMSRTSLVALVIGAGYLYVIQLLATDRGVGSRMMYLALPTSVLLVAMAYVLVNPMLYEAIGWRFYTLIEFQTESSWQVRLNTWQKNIQLFFESPIVGVGPLRRAESTAGPADNEWLLLLRTYGIVGTLVLVVGMVWPHLKAKSRLLRVFITGMLLGMAVYMIPAAVFHSLSLMPLVLIILAAEDSTTRPVTIV